MTEIHLNDEALAFIEEQVKTGAYESAEDVVAAGLSRLGSEDELLRTMIAEADAQLERGEFVRFDNADTHADSIIERGMRILNRKS
ncbi:addiction module antitoxin [Rhizobium sp. Leaf306]|jgi:antitoxin ParD1/3/4|uniref:ribbon-helix-helix domain-containing protein n=1 Tax=Rhizobium/Agrobacterium group TaxID=227290 RepID=UPI000715879A|nr:type II toxin-antitoxin system ParD family antitoxin [Rhizobium sp. Leaf306]KQQ37738.1 addiction module antitoxin [Rhizobium sp. Leaf306]